MSEGRRVRKMLVTAELLGQMFTAAPQDGDRWAGISSDAPEGMRVIGASWDFDMDAAVLFVEHESFDVLIEGQEPPAFTPEYTSHWFEDEAIAHLSTADPAA